VSFASPARNALVRGEEVPVRLTVGSQIKDVRVFAGAKDISSRFTRHGETYAAQLPRSLFQAGTNRLLVQAEAGNKPAGADTVSFIVPRDTPDLMRTTSAPERGQERVTIQTKRATFAQLKVNGRRVEDLRSTRPLTEHNWLVSARDGLKAGRNTFTVESWDAHGRHSVKRWTVTRDHDHPLAEAGEHERVVNPHDWTTLDGSKSRPSRGKLDYAWRVVRAPKDAKPQLRNASSAKPSFQADKPGVYQVALRAQDAQAAAEDVVTLDAVPTLGKQGLYVSTSFEPQQDSSAPDDTLRIEGQPFSYTTNGNLDTFVQLDEATLAIKASGTHTQITPTAGTITIGAWMNTPGATDLYPWGSSIWIGTKKVADTETTTDPGDGVGNPTSNLHGWIQPAATAGADNATWVDSDMLQVKTREPTDTTTQNTMEINGHQYPQTLAAGQTGGWHLVLLDNAGQSTTNQLYPVGTEDQLASALNNVNSEGYGNTVLLQAFGRVPAPGLSSNLATAIAAVGGRADVVSRVNGADASGGVYALISGSSGTANNKWSEYAADEASFERTQATGTLTSLLVRDATQNNYIPFSSDHGALDPAGANRYSFLPLIYQAPTDWTNWVRDDVTGALRAPTPQESAAFTDLVNEVAARNWVPKTKLCPTAPDVIRGYYCDTDATQMETFLNRVSNQLKFNATTANNRYAESDWDNVQETIENEIGDVSNLRAEIADYQGLFGTASIDGAVNAPAIGNAVQQAINTATTTTTNAGTENALSALTDMASVIPEIGPEMTFISGAFGLMAGLEPNTSPQAILDEVTVSQTTAAATLVAEFQNASAQLSDYGDLVVADPVKLQQGAIFLLDNDPQTSDTDSAFVHAAEYATQQWLWGTLLAPAYSAWRFPVSWGNNPQCDNETHGGYPWQNLDDSGRWLTGPDGTSYPAIYWLLGYDSDTASSTDQWSWVSNNGSHGYNEIGLPPSITDPLFGQPVSGTAAPSVTANAGAIMPYFALDYLQVKNLDLIPESHWDQNPTVNGCEPHAGVAPS
jgi:hypothetical protein